MAEVTDLRGWLDQTPALEEHDTFGEGAAAFTVKFKRVDKADLEKLFRTARKPVKDMRTGVKHYEEDVEKFRSGLVDMALVGWDGLTLRKVALLTNRPADLLNGMADRDVAFSKENAKVLLERARASMSGDPISFEDWIVQRASTLAEQSAAEEAASKNA